MADREFFFFRNEAFSLFHRTCRLSEFVDKETARTMSMIDLDGVMYCLINGQSYPLALIETAIDKDQEWKNYKGTQILAQRARLLAWVIFYKLSTEPSPADPFKKVKDICSMRIMQISPEVDGRGYSQILAKDYCAWELDARERAIRHIQSQPNSPFCE
jgi:hypothetical protein